MSRTTPTTKPARTAKPKPAPAAAKDAPEKDTERMTAFNSHGQRYYRLTIPKAFGALYENSLNRWHCETAGDGTVTFKPVGRLVKAS